MKHKFLSFLLVCCLLAALVPALAVSAAAAGRAWEAAYESVIQAKAGRSGCVLQLVDLDQDNTPELLIGSVPGSFQTSFVDYAYTYKDGQAKALAFTSGGDSVLSSSTESDYALKQYPKEAYTLYRNRSTGAYRVEGGHTVHGGISMPNYWYIDTFSIKNDRLEVLPASFYVTYAIQYDVVTPSYYVNDAKTTKAAFDSARTAWYAGWEKVEGFPSCEQYFWSKPTAKETRDFLASYPTFWDVPSDAYYHDAVLWAYDKGITYGTSDTTFSPSDTVTRAQAMTFLWRAMGMPAPESDTNPFSDVKESDYYYAAVLWAVEQGITEGTSDSTFSPEQTCSTAHMVTFLYRTLGVGENGWYQEAAAWAEQEGLLVDTNKTVSPETDCPRADVVTFLYRKLN